MNNEQKRFNELAERVIAWADQKGILAKGTPDAQFGKFLEECTELWKALVVDDKEQIKDGVGDVAVTIIIWCKLSKIKLPYPIIGLPETGVTPQMYLGRVIEMMLEARSDGFGYNCPPVAIAELREVPSMLTEDWLDCLEYALNIIEKRNGRMVNGTFVKDVNNELLKEG